MPCFYHVILVNPFFKCRQDDDISVTSQRERGKLIIMSCDKVEVSQE